MSTEEPAEFLEYAREDRTSDGLFRRKTDSTYVVDASLKLIRLAQSVAACWGIIDAALDALDNYIHCGHQNPFVPQISYMRRPEAGR
jgi:hypothetical protein